jgi:hypothetical protein
VLFRVESRFVEGYNVCVLAFGATGSGKTFTLEGSRGKDAAGPSFAIASHAAEVTQNGNPGRDQGDGVVHWAVDEV